MLCAWQIKLAGQANDGLPETAVSEMKRDAASLTVERVAADAVMLALWLGCVWSELIDD
jgi:hypothetical protein